MFSRSGKDIKHRHPVCARARARAHCLFAIVDSGDKKMQLPQLVFSLLSIASVASAIPTIQIPGSRLPLVESKKLRRALTRAALLNDANELFKFSQKAPDHNRAFGGVGHNLTVDYLYNTFKTGHMADYYTVKKQKFIHEYAYGTSKVGVSGRAYDSLYFTYSPSTHGDLQLHLGVAANVGCVPVREIYIHPIPSLIAVDSGIKCGV